MPIIGYSSDSSLIQHLLSLPLFSDQHESVCSVYEMIFGWVWKSQQIRVSVCVCVLTYIWLKWRTFIFVGWAFRIVKLICVSFIFFLCVVCAAMFFYFFFFFWSVTFGYIWFKPNMLIVEFGDVEILWVDPL